MAQPNPYSGPRSIALAMAAIAAVTAIISVITTPLGEWTTWNYVIGALLVVFAIVFAIQGARNKVNLLGRLSARTGVILGAIGAVGSALGMLAGITSSDTTVSAVQTTGLWLALFVMFVGTIVVARRQTRDEDTNSGN